ncbi:glycosyl hydrolase family 18 protein [Clostridium ihumii]|uniref:glycosyl hydrolase family 18 protein n=1 Tax=Clostridium ihumii TaxID=1470356 RepID=UPI0009441CA2|nr:glycosyl hydrolase family 18 protein [Clostridium ihumii]
MKNKELMKKVLVATMMTTMISSMGAGALIPSMEVFAQTVKSEEVSKSDNKDSLGKRNVMYYGDWSIWGGQGNFYPKDIPADQLTHLNFAFIDFDANGNLIFTDKDAAVGAPVGQEGVQWGAPNAGILIALQQLRAENPNLKLGISVGGWSKSGDFSEMASNSKSRENFIKNIIKFIDYTNMDFVDLDWEYPSEVREADLVDNANDEGTPNAKPQDKENYIKLLEELRVELNNKGIETNKYYELTVALPAAKSKVDSGIDVDKLFNIVDFANIMTYDLRGAWDNYSGHQTGLYPNENDPINNQSGNKLSVDESVNYLIEKGAEPEKIVIGAAYYTRGWNKVEKGSNAELPGLFGEAEKNGRDADQTPSYGAPNEAPLKSGDGGRASGVWAYRSLDKLKSQYPGLKEYWDEKAKAPYLYDESTGKFFTYDNVKSIEEKGKYVHENNLGGIIGWMSSQDASTNNTSKRDELQSATKNVLFGDEKLPEYEINYSDLDVTATVSTYEQQWGADRKGYEITIKNNERSEETDSVLREVEKGAETIKAPKLYIKSDKSLKSGDYTAGTVTYENGYTVVDLQSVWEGKNIEQGQSYTFKLLGDAKIESVELVQRMSSNSPDMNRQTIFGEVDEEVKPEINNAPIIIGLSNKTINIGDDFDPLHDVTANDKEDGDLTDKIVVEGNVDTNKQGKYTLKYSVSDSKGETTTKNRIITVEEKTTTPEPEINEAPILKGVIDKTINIGDKFDSLEGITANDKEDGDLTDKIVVEGNVDTNKVGKYKLTYSVSDSKGETVNRNRTITVEESITGEPEDPKSDFGVGQGIEWPSQVNSPYADMTRWNSGEFSNNGALNLKKIAEDTGVKFFNLGFIQSTSGISNGKVNWGWGGYDVLNEKNADNSQYQGIKKSIKDVRELGGDVTISLGGLNGVSIWEVTQDVDILFNTYKEIVEGYGLTRLDLDIEGGPATNKNHNIANAKAIKKLQDATGVDVVLTLAVLPSGLTSVQLDVLEAYLSQGVDVKLVNIMTMAYGNGTLLPGENYGTGSLRAVDSTKNQLKNYFKKYADVTLTDEEAYRKIGTTPSIGFEGAAHPLFTTEWTELVVNHAIDKGIGMTSMWSINRDSMAESNEGVLNQYEFSNIFKNFGIDDEVNPGINSAPILKGVIDKTIKVGDNFDPMEGVTASDKEDGTLTDKIEIEGEVDTSKSGKYKLIYKVSDSNGKTATATRVITVKEESQTSDTYDANKIYLQGDTVIYKGDKYTAKWWVKGENPDKSQAWEKEVIPNEDGSLDYYEGMICVGGTRVVYNGKVYEAKWWTNTLPGSDGSWKVIE